MNDFLQSLRGGQKDKRTAKTRRNFDNGNFNTSPNYQNHGNYQGTRAGNLKRPSARGTVHSHMPGGEHQPSYAPTIDTFDVILDLLDAYTKNQEMLITVQEKRIIAEERKAIALEEIAEYLRVITMPSFHEEFPLKRTSASSEVPITKEIDVESDDILSKRPESQTIESKSAKSYEVISDVENLDTEHIDTKGANSDRSELQIPDTQHSDTTQYADAEDNIARDLQAEPESSSEDDSDDELKKSIKVIRRKKSDNKERTSISKAHADDLSTNKPWAAAVPIKEEKNIFSKTDETELSGKKELTITPQKDNPLLSREEVMDIIHSMRAQGKTFDEVAQHLVSLGQPTFSGRGEWHAQTIHRLCTRKSTKDKKK